jgi:hypothetical protein
MWHRLRQQDKRVLAVAGGLVVLVAVLALVAAARSSRPCGDYCVDTGGRPYLQGETDGRVFAERNGLQGTVQPGGIVDIKECGAPPDEAARYGYTSLKDGMNFGSGYLKGCADVSRGN